MDAARLTLFRNARRFEQDLNERQREVLARIARGQTNAEIAAALDMTFDGAKWNVSEILTKLNFSSREEAAAYWHWRRGIGSRVGSALRSMVPASLPMKLVAGGGLSAVAIVVVLLALSGGSPERAATVEIPPYRMVAISGTRADPDGAGGSLILEWQDETHFRNTTIGGPDDPHDAGEIVTIVADGQHIWVDNSSLPEYSRFDLGFLTRNQPAAARASFSLGPTRLATIDALLEMLRNPPEASGLESPRFAEVVGNDTHLGVPVVIVEYRDVWRPETNSDGRSSSGAGTKIWIDPTTMFVLRYEIGPLNSGPPDDAFLTREVTSIEYNVDFPRETFTFVPPPGKREAVPTPTSPASNVP